MNTEWTEERARQFLQLEDLLQLCRSIDSGSSVIEKLQRIIVIAEELSRDDVAKLELGFMTFLRDVCIEGRKAITETKEKRNGLESGIHDL